MDEERQLRLLVKEGKGSDEISRVMDKTRVSIKAKLSNLGLHLKAATGSAAQNSAATASAASSPHFPAAQYHSRREDIPRASRNQTEPATTYTGA